MVESKFENAREAAAELSGHDLSKRAGRRLIQRAFVLAGRDRNVRQHIREARLGTLWILDDWDFEWSVSIDRGKLIFDRRPIRKPDVTLAWPRAEEFFKAVEEGGPIEATARIEGDILKRKYYEPVLHAFSRALAGVMRHPFDDAGNRLA